MSLLPEMNSDIVNLSYTRYDFSDGKTQHHEVSSHYQTSQGDVRRTSGYRVSVQKKRKDLSNKKQQCFQSSGRYISTVPGCW